MILTHSEKIVPARLAAVVWAQPWRNCSKAFNLKACTSDTT